MTEGMTPFMWRQTYGKLQHEHWTDRDRRFAERRHLGFDPPLPKPWKHNKCR